MPDEKCRNILFWSLCLPARLTVATLIFILGNSIFPYNIILCYIIASVFLLKFADQACSSREEYLGGFGGVVYWHEARIVHAIIYATTATLLIRISWAGVFLYLDIFVALYTHAQREYGV